MNFKKAIFSALFLSALAGCFSWFGQEEDPDADPRVVKRHCYACHALKMPLEGISQDSMRRKFDDEGLRRVLETEFGCGAKPQVESHQSVKLKRKELDAVKRYMLTFSIYYH